MTNGIILIVIWTADTLRLNIYGNRRQKMFNTFEDVIQEFESKFSPINLIVLIQRVTNRFVTIGFIS